MTYEEIYNRALYKLTLSNIEVKEYKPASPEYVNELIAPIPNAIIIYLKSGDKIIFINKEGRNGQKKEGK